MLARPYLFIDHVGEVDKDGEVEKSEHNLENGDVRGQIEQRRRARYNKAARLQAARDKMERAIESRAGLFTARSHVRM